MEYKIKSVSRVPKLKQNKIKLNPKLYVPIRTPNFWFKITEIISLPPAEPRDLKTIPAPVPIMTPPERVARIISFTGIWS